MTISLALAAAAGGPLPSPLLQLASPFRARLEHLGQLGKGGFGSVVAARSRLDGRLMAVKAVPFRSPLPPWAPPGQLERRHAKLLREVQALAGLDGSPHVVRYFTAWIEPAWEKLGQALAQRGGAAGLGKVGVTDWSSRQGAP
ncbi:hypothetical protein GPECTOR_12g530 [Gonium pectorale]|uniref:Protein kinase domain-containing protein n=1 Tax=Gonium pectorale TaxID=33097 RepID=A0A150GP17_GONPE|nr:hypothetical protein GPECTOR_12g530 [Gonium pectorale]|eukprot:KXZ51567.1 hypothetical protein GPECTOR_12g530 [Gonium pectorale]